MILLYKILIIDLVICSGQYFLKLEAVDCGNPTTLLKEQESIQESRPFNTIYKSNLSIICESGFIWDDKSEKPVIIECLYTGLWSKIPKSCTSKHIFLLKFEGIKICSFTNLENKCNNWAMKL